MSHIDDLLKAVKNLNDSTTGATKAWKAYLQSSNQSQEIATKVANLSVLDDACNAELQSYTQNPPPDDKALEDLTTIIAGYLAMTNKMYISLLSVTTPQKKMVDSVQKAVDILNETVREAKNSLSVRKSSLKITPSSLVFNGSIGGPTPTSQVVTVTNTDSTPISWQAAEEPNGTWLMVSPTQGNLQPDQTASVKVVALLQQGLNPQPDPYTGSITIKSSHADEVIENYKIPVNFYVLQPCTLLPPSVSNLTFNVAQGTRRAPSPQRFTISTVGACDSISIAPIDEPWLQTEVLQGKNTATITATIDVSELPSIGSHEAILTIYAGKREDIKSGNDGILGSPQFVTVTLTVTAAPQLSVSPRELPAISLTSGSTASSAPITISNTGGGVLNWNARLDSNTPDFITLSPSSNTSLMGGTNTSITVDIDATKVDGGVTYNNIVEIIGVDPNNGNVVVGMDQVSITVTIAENLFMCLMNQHSPNTKVTKLTEQLFRGREKLELSDRTLEKLVKSWDEPVKLAATQPASSACLGPKPLANLIDVQSQLEELYDRIERNVIRVDKDLFDLE